jgi:hypothetical protein
VDAPAVFVSFLLIQGDIRLGNAVHAVEGEGVMQPIKAGVSATSSHVLFFFFGVGCAEGGNAAALSTSLLPLFARIIR